VSDELNIVAFGEHSTGPQAELSSDENRPPWAAIATVSALVVFYLVVILTTLLVRQPSPTTANGITAQPVAPSTTVSAVGAGP
jgi:hypothetical protein